MKRILLLFAAALTAQASTDIITCDPSPSPGVTGYNFYVSTNPTAPKPWTLLVSVPGTTATNGNVAALPTRTYYYATAQNQYGESDPSVAAFRPLSPTGLKFAGNTLTWNACPAAELVTNYKVYWTADISTLQPWTFLTSTTGTSVNISSLPNSVYFYCTAVNPSESVASAVANKPGPPPKLQIQ